MIIYKWLNSEKYEYQIRNNNFMQSYSSYSKIKYKYNAYLHVKAQFASEMSALKISMSFIFGQYYNIEQKA